jgi:hypothetical protein
VSEKARCYREILSARFPEGLPDRCEQTVTRDEDRKCPTIVHGFASPMTETIVRPPGEEE